jgi:hypothetical protein
MTYQGLLTDANGVPLGNDSPRNYTAIFRIYSVATGGGTIWTEQQTVTVDKGYFSVLLGEGSAVGIEPRANLSTIFTGSSASDRYIGITVKGLTGTTDVEIAPRLQLLASPYSFLARNAVSLVNDIGQPFVTITSGTLAAIGIGAPLQSTGSGGDARGAGAVDLQVRRTDATKVAAGEASVIAGGSANRTASRVSTVGGGEQNVASAGKSTVAGGSHNAATGENGTVGGGSVNTASGLNSTVAGGMANTASGQDGVVVGGNSNFAGGLRSIVAGGLFNNAAGDYSFAAGRKAKANHLGSFVWADSTDADYGSGAANEFRVRANGGVKISGAPARTLDAARQLMVTDTELNAANTGMSLGFHHIPNVSWGGVIQSLGAGTPNELRLNPSGGQVVVGSGGLRVDGSVTGGGTIPVGGIILWSGAITAIPSGWRLCDGNGGTPDLRDRFVVGAGSGYAVGTKAGSSSVTLSVNNLPAHSHRISDLDRTGNPDGWRDGGRHYWRNASYQGHGDQGKQTDNTGGNQPFSILPPYYALAYIMRVQ